MPAHKVCLSLAATTLVQWLFSAPTALDLLRQAFRQILIDVERACLSLAFGGNLKVIEIGNEVLKQTEKLGKFKILRQSRLTIAAGWELRSKQSPH